MEMYFVRVPSCPANLSHVNDQVFLVKHQWVAEEYLAFEGAPLYSQEFFTGLANGRRKDRMI